MEIDYNSLLEEYNAIVNKISELKLIKKILNEFVSQEENFVNIGGMILAKVKILDDKKFLVNVGNRVFIEKNKEEIIKTIDKNIEQLEKKREELENLLRPNQ
ncbi:MAG: hypothetical protein BXU00_01180 [Candidatus Nanoclepta minutus]|uniref:Prefoldin subunit alpha n=1 Tax=Candidatus Nanoclepta minutus TaxID=1940235 RepID=A0A397WRK0_9ARCH|nr:MAG: hypothetical protein BXU00_01180 [Candidatus Nanoclepta minutus]